MAVQYLNLPIDASSTAFKAWADSITSLTNSVNNAILTVSGVTAGTYGSSSAVGQFTVDAYGIITSASNVSIDHNSLTNYVANKHIDHSTVSISAGTGLTGGGTIASTRTLSLADTAVTTGSYGSATQVPQITIDQQGRITAATNVTLTSSGVAFRGCLVTLSSQINTVNATGGYTIGWDTETYDTDSIHDNSTNNSRLTVPSGISYVKLSYGVFLNGVATGDVFRVRCYKNGSGSWPGVPRIIVGNGAATVPSASGTSAVVAVSSGDYFEINILIGTDTSVNIDVDSWFAMELIQ